jgi:repressor LexA
VSEAEPPGGFSDRQVEILYAIRRFTAEKGRPPAIDEVRDAIGLKSVSTVYYHYGNLRKKGHLREEEGRRRTVEVRLPDEPPFPADSDEPSRVPVPPGPPPSEDAAEHARPRNVVWLPIVARIAAGAPVLVQQEPETEYLPFPMEWVGGEVEDLFILKVEGDSMTGVGIFPGDLVVVRKLYETPRDGDIVAATIKNIEEEGTVKTYKRYGSQVWLMPQNPAYPGIPGNRAKFAGKVIAVLRQV